MLVDEIVSARTEVPKVWEAASGFLRGEGRFVCMKTLF